MGPPIHGDALIPGDPPNLCSSPVFGILGVPNSKSQTQIETNSIGNILCKIINDLVLKTFLG